MSDKSFSSLDLAALDVLRRYPTVRPEDGAVALGNRGGFSGARLWRVQGTAATYCLRAWPPKDPAPDRLSWIHGLMQRARNASLNFVPAIAPSNQNTTWVAHGGRLWELATWMPGCADFHERPTNARLEAACTALACLHGAWQDVSPQVGPCPGIGRRLQIAREWMEIIKSGWHPPFQVDAPDPVRPWLERAWALLRTRIVGVPCALASWAERSLPLQPCLCDIWHDHVLFDGDTVAGLIDYGGVKVDHVAVDLARMLGSMVEDNGAERLAGLQAYARLRPLSSEEEALVNILDETGTIIALANWLKWIYWDGKLFEDRSLVAQRLSKLVERVEKWNRSIVRSRFCYGLRTTD